MTHQFDHEKLDVYQVQLGFLRWVTGLLADVKGRDGAPTREVRDQLDRAALSVLLNIAEGNGKRQRQIRVRYFDDARGSTAECAACLDALVAKGVCSPEQIAEGKQSLVRVSSMLTKLVGRFSGAPRVRESDGEYVVGREGIEDDDEDDDEDDSEDN